MACLVIVEHEQGRIKPATLHTVSAARQLDSAVDLVIFTHAQAALAEEAARIEGVRTVLVADHLSFEPMLAEPLSHAISTLAPSYEHILAPGSTFGKDVLPRVAALLGVMQISEVMHIHSPDTFDRPMYAGNIIATIQSSDPIKVLTVRTTAFEKAGVQSVASAAIQQLTMTVSDSRTQFISQQRSESVRPELGAARVVISGGRGLQSGENFKLLEALADRLGAAIGASRAAVDAGFVPNDYQVGQTGKIVAPELYIAIGISGAIQHVAGMKDSKVIVAINKDPDAPIFQIADYALVGDLFQIIPELIAALNASH